MPAKKKQMESVLDELREATKREGGLYLNESEKDDLAEDATPLTFTSIKRTTTVYKGKESDRWECEFTADDKRRILSIPCHDDRDKMMNSLAKIAKRDKSVGPLVLTIKPGKDGKRWYWLTVPSE